MRLGLLFLFRRMPRGYRSSRRLNITQRLAQASDFLQFDRWNCAPILEWLEMRRLYWASLIDADTGLAAVRWQPLKLPSRHHPNMPPTDPVFSILIVVLFIVIFAR